jgi:hypothetical protein
LVLSLLMRMNCRKQAISAAKETTKVCQTFMV